MTERVEVAGLEPATASAGDGAAELATTAFRARERTPPRHQIGTIFRLAER